MEKTTSIKKLKLCSQYYVKEDRKLNPQTLSPIAEALKVNSSVEKLLLTETNIKDDGVTDIVEAIKAYPNSKINFLNLSFCGMTYEGRVAVHSLPHTVKVRMNGNS